MNRAMTSEAEHEQKKLGWLKRLGWTGFLFFFLKGLVWLAVFLGAGKLFTG